MSDAILNPTESIILDELRGLRGSFDAFAGDMRERVATLEAHDHDITGNGQQGRMADAEDEIDLLKSWRWKLTGAAAAASAIFGTFGAWIFEHIFHK